MRDEEKSRTKCRNGKNSDGLCVDSIDYGSYLILIHLLIILITTTHATQIVAELNAMQSFQK
jgi:hypothetical protein